MARVERFAYEQLPRWTRREATLATLAARTLFTDPCLLGSTKKALDSRFEAVFEGLEYTIKLPKVHTREAIVAAYSKRPSVHSIFSLASEDVISASVGAFSLDAPMARWIAARALGMSEQDARRWLAPIEWTPGMEGAYAMVCSQAAWRALNPGILPTFRAATESWEDVAHALGSGDWVLWSVHLRAGSVTGLGTMLLPMRALKPKQSLNAESLARARSLSVEAHLVAGSARFSAEDVSRWSMGELLVLDGLHQGENGLLLGPMLVRVGAGECKVVVEQHRIVAEEPLHPKGTAMTDIPDNAGTDPVNRTALLATLTVDVEVIVAKSTVTVAEVSAWRPGEVIAMPTPINTPVEVRAGGRLVARGELCTVDQEIGVRITELL